MGAAGERRGRPWGPDDIGDLSGRVALVTGAEGGVGFETAVELAAHGALVVLGCADDAAGRRAAVLLGAHDPLWTAELLDLDPADPGSVRAAADRFAARHDRLDLLVHAAAARRDAGPAARQALELLGPYALTGLLLGHLRTSGGSRVVTVRGPRPGVRPPVGLVFTAELQRRLTAADASCVAVAARRGPLRARLPVDGPVAPWAARPVLYAATARDVVGGAEYRAGGPGGLWGPVVRGRTAGRARHPAAGRALWARAEAATGVHYDGSSGPQDAPAPRGAPAGPRPRPADRASS